MNERFRVTVRGESDAVELRGYVDGFQTVRDIAAVLKNLNPTGPPIMVVASPAEDDYDPFAWPDVQATELQEVAEALRSHQSELEIQVTFRVEGSQERLAIVTGLLEAFEAAIEIRKRSTA